MPNKTIMTAYFTGTSNRSHKHQLRIPWGIKIYCKSVVKEL